MSEKATFSQVLQNRGFLNLWINQILVQLSYNALNFALIIWVFKLTDSTTAVSALIFAIYLPAVLFGLFTGVLVDLIDKKKIIMIINFFLALSFFSLIFLKDSYPVLLTVTFFINVLGQFYMLAEVSALPIIVKKTQLISANSLFSATLYISFLLGFGFSGPLLSYLGINFVFALGGVLLILAFFLSLLFPSIITTPDGQGKKLVLAIRKRKYKEIYDIGGFEVLRTIRLIRGKLSVLTSIMILAGVQAVIGVLAVLLPGFLEKSLQIKATDASHVLVVPLGLGIVAGGMVLSKIGDRLIKRRLVARAILFGGLLFFLVGISPLIYQPPSSKVLIVGSFLLGLAMVSILVPTQTVLQKSTVESTRGKVFSVLGVAMAAFTLIPVLLSGVLADIFGVTPIFIGLGGTIILIGLFGLRPSLFFAKHQLPFKMREFLGLGHWKK